jgi:hypothetical protein
MSEQLELSMTWSEFVDFFKPETNKFSKDPDQQMYETYGEELEHVQRFDPHYVWTYLDTDGGSVTVEGFHYVNRIGYFITEKPWLDGVSYEIDLQVDSELCADCGEAETPDGEIIMEVFKCDAQQEYCLNCCRCPEHEGEPWY